MININNVKPSKFTSKLNEEKSAIVAKNELATEIKMMTDFPNATAECVAQHLIVFCFLQLELNNAKIVKMIKN